MRRAVLLLPAVLFALAGCGPAATTGGHSLTGADRAACDAPELGEHPNPDPDALNAAFGVDGTARGMSPNLSPYALLVGSSAQLILSGADDGKLGEYVGQMRGVCETLGWRAGP